MVSKAWFDHCTQFHSLLSIFFFFFWVAVRTELEGRRELEVLVEFVLESDWQFPAHCGREVKTV